MIRHSRSPAMLLAVLLALLFFPGMALAVSNIFTYQGSLEDGGQPAEGSYDLQFQLQTLVGADVGMPVLRNDVVVSGGVFTVELDFGTAINSGDFRLQIGVRPGDSVGSYTLLSPPTRIAPTPQAQVAGLAAEAVTVSPNSITSASIADETIVSADIADGSVTSADIANSTIVSADIADGTVASADIADSTVVSADIADGTVASTDIANSTIVSADIADGTVASADIANETIVSADIADGSIAASDINNSQIQQRVATGCGIYEAIRSINQDGTVVCVQGQLGPAGSGEVAFGTLYLFDNDFGDTRNFAVDGGRLALLNSGSTDYSSELDFSHASGNTIISVNTAGLYELRYDISFRATDAAPDISMSTIFSFSYPCDLTEIENDVGGFAPMEVDMVLDDQLYYPISGSDIVQFAANACFALKAYEVGPQADNEAEMVRARVIARRIK